jgi:hypothetical protein
MEGDSQAAVEYAAEHLRITILEDYHFYSWLLKWWQEADGVRSFLERSQAAVREQILSALTFWITTEIGEEALRDILAENSSVAEKRALIQEKLSEASDVKWGKIKKRSLTEQPYSPLIAFALLIAVGTLVLSTNSPLELLGYLALLGLAIVIWFWFKARKITTTRKGTA